MTGQTWLTASAGIRAASCSTPLAEAIDVLPAAGCRQLWLNGSVVTAKEEPADFNTCWDTDGVDPHRLDPVLLDLRDGRATQKRRFGGELSPNVIETGSGAQLRRILRPPSETLAARESSSPEFGDPP